ncbi:MAG TPA: hypothetical protein VNL13_08320 [Sulfolobales archaeon]|nr:hypothetical protein [Sulfolobales archaeon]
MPGGYFPTNAWVSISLERYCPRCGPPHTGLGRRWELILDGSPMPFSSAAAHEPIGIPRSLWARLKPLDIP